MNQLGARTLLGGKGIATRSKRTLLGAPGIATRSKDTTRAPTLQSGKQVSGSGPLAVAGFGISIAALEQFRRGDPLDRA